MAALGVFGLCQIHAFVDYLRSKLNPQQFEILFRSVISLVGFVLLTIGAVLMLTGVWCDSDASNAGWLQFIDNGVSQECSHDGLKKISFNWKKVICLCLELFSD